MKKKWFLILVISLIFTGGRIAAAAENGGHKDMSGDHSDSHNMEGMDMSGDHSNSDHNMEGMDMNGDDSDSHEHGTQQKDSNEMEGMNMGESGHSHGPVKETPPNIKVLGTYGAVNLSFIMIGIWGKWFRRKDGSDGDSK